MVKKTLLFTLGALFCLNCLAQEKRALLIGIDKYEAPAGYKPTGINRSQFGNLDGCVNDAMSIYSIITSKFQFSEKNIDTLYNKAAGRAMILKKFEDLLEKSKPNDFAFIYYAGHGSQVPNSLSPESDKKDESMVPSDTWQQGVEDIRDKELAKIYNRFVDKGVKLTVIMDCCHSGSLSRGPIEPGKFRFIEDAKYDAKDASKPAIPEDRKEGTFLIMSAAMDNEYAQEQMDEHQMPHGAFTIALTQALEQQSVNASVANLFTSIRAILKSNGKKQEPVLGGLPERQQQTLFGFEKGSLTDKSMVAVSGIENGKVMLQGGFALGLYKENELVKVTNKDTIVKLVIDSVISVNRSIASVIKGNIKDLKPGELLEVTNWVSSSAPLLKVYIPTGNMSNAEITRLAGLNKELRQSSQIKWINNLEKTDPYTSVYHNGTKFMVNVDGKAIAAPANLTTASLLQLSKKDSSFYFELPASKDLTTAIKEKFSENKSFSLTTNASDAQYILYGTIDEEGKPAYGLRRAQTSARDSLESMPIQTKYFVSDNNDGDGVKAVADKLYETAMRLAKIRGWQQLAGPKEGDKSFPFHLELTNNATDKLITNNEYYLGDNISYHLVLNKGYDHGAILKRYVYVFVIDKDGNMILAYPDPNAGNRDNQFPKYDNNILVNKVPLLDGSVEPPLGTDNYYLLASDEPITNYALLFNQEGVRSAARGGNPLGNLLNMGNEEGTRGFGKSVSNWSLIRLAVKSKSR